MTPVLVIAAICLVAIGTLVYRELPVFGILSIALIARVWVDGRYGFNVFGFPATNVIGLLLILLGVVALLRGTKLWIPLLGASVATGLSAASVASAVPSVIDEWLRLVSVFAVVAVMANLPVRPSPGRLIGVVQIAGLGSALLSLVQFATGTGHSVDGVMRATGTMAHPNSAALLYGAVAMMSIVKFLERGHNKRDILVTAVMVVAIVLSGSMGGIVGLVVMAATYAALSAGISAKARAATIAFGTIGALAFVFSPLGSARIAELAGLDLSGARGEQNSLEWRVARWRELLTHWREEPFFGLGYGATANGAYLNGYAPHNEYVRLLAEVGVVGLAVILVVGIAIMVRLRIVERAQGPESSIARGALAMGVGFALNATVENTFLYTAPMYILAMVTTYALVYSQVAPARRPHSRVRSIQIAPSSELSVASSSRRRRQV